MKNVMSMAYTAIVSVFLIAGCADGVVKNEETLDMVLSAPEMAPVEEAMSVSETKAKQSNNTVSLLSPDVQNYVVSLATADVSDYKRPIIKTVSLRFKVKDVVQSNIKIEKAVIANDGFILRSDIENERAYSFEQHLSADSSLLVTHYNMSADMSVRVPQALLHKFLEDISAEAVAIDYRHFKGDDLKIRLYANQLEQARLDRKTQRLGTSIATRSGKLSDVIDAEQARDDAESNVDAAKVQDFKMKDDIEFSVINIELYQNPTMTEERIARVKYLEEVKPSMSVRLQEAMGGGWTALCAVFVFTVNIWPLIVIGVIIGFIIYRRMRSKKKD